jgi:hypothetical protein
MKGMVCAWEDVQRVSSTVMVKGKRRPRVTKSQGQRLPASEGLSSALGKYCFLAGLKRYSLVFVFNYIEWKISSIMNDAPSEHSSFSS